MGSLPLTGVRVVDFGRFIAAPYCAMLMADFGADVIRVERRGGGEDRYVGPIAESGEGGLFLNLNRNKRGITLDLAHPVGAEITSRLIKSADIVIVNLPIDVMKKLGLDYDSLRLVKPDIILVMASAFGADGPYAERVGFDSVAQAMSGATILTGFPGAPVRAIVPYVDYGTALHAAFGAMMALYERQKTGRGQVIDVSLLATSITFMMPLLAEQKMTRLSRKQQGNASYYAGPGDIYRVVDGWVLISVVGEPMFRRWASVVRREDLINDPRCKDDLTRADNHELITEIMNEWCAERTREQAIAALEQARVPCGPVYDLDEVLGDPQVKARKTIGEMKFSGSRKPVPIAGTPLQLGATPAEVRRSAPALGEHTAEVLSELNFSTEEIQSFRRVNAI
ncbi:MAG TPA: CoA transferase [Pyrinomonadaceae bacterium]|nr:CoA transferase [Pyrinomonadaceae bacterium]